MPKVQEKIPEQLRPFVFHGVEIRWKDNNDQATGDCPFCGREGKFAVTISTGQWRCFVCNEGFDKKDAKGNIKPIRGGNAVEFLRILHKCSLEATKPEEYKSFALSRKLLDFMTLVAWNLCRSTLNGDWLVPGWNTDSALCQLYRYCGADKKKLIPTPTLGHQLFFQSWDATKPNVFVNEGPWDGMALWEVLRQAKVSDSGLVETGNESASMLANINLIAVPGCETFHENWLSLFNNRSVSLFYDSDHPREHQGRVIPPAGFNGLQRVAGLAAISSHPPSRIEYLQWGTDGYNSELPSGYDVRDHLTAALHSTNGQAHTASPLASRITRLSELLGQMVVFSTDAAKSEASGPTSDVKVGKIGKDLLPLHCTEYRTLVQSWRKAMKWTDGLDYGLSMMLSTSLSTMSVGDQIFLRLMSPASTGKTSIAEGLGVAKKYVKTIDTLRGFTSGYRLPDGSTSDLATDLHGMTLITMDGDTLLQLPNLPNILSEGRRLYDGTLNSHFKNNTGKDISGHRMTWIVLGTGSLRQMDSSELGTRFIDCVMMETIDDDLEDEILMRIANRSEANVSMQSTSGVADTQRDKYQTEAMRLTGGYVNYLRENAGELLISVDMSEQYKMLCTRFGKFIAFMRARPSKKQEEVHEREMAGRLVSTLTRITKCLAAVMNKTEVDNEVMRRIRRSTLDSSRGQSLEIVELLHKALKGQYPFEVPTAGLETKSFHVFTGRDESKLRSHLRYLKHLGVVEFSKAELKGGVVSKSLWMLTPKIRKLYEEVIA